MSHAAKTVSSRDQEKGPCLSHSQESCLKAEVESYIVMAREGHLGCSLNTGGGFGEFGDRRWEKESTLGLQMGTQSY